MDLASIGWNAGLEAALRSCAPQGERACGPPGGLAPARVSADHGGALEVLSAAGVLRAELSGRLAYQAAGPEDLPGVGDWVAIAARPDEGAATVHAVLPRRTLLLRRAAGRATRAQVLAANVDAVLIVASANLDWSPRRLERTLALVRESGAAPVVVLSKIDLCDDVEALRSEAEAAAPGVPVLALSAWSGAGLDGLAAELSPARTLALLGSSGVGKSSLVNRLLGRELLATREIRADDDKGRHATSHRQLVILPGGALLIDTPGLREVGLLEEADLARTFPELEALAAQCRFSDCRHEAEPGCAVRRAVDEGRLDPARIASQRKLERELQAARARRDPRARHEQRERMKRFARALRQRPDKRRPDRG
jgi:ribosome biogenesis GTPase